MRRRPDIIDRMLEHWASWRITEEIYSGTGNSSIVRFLEPAGTPVNGCHPLYFGRSNRSMAALNSDLISQLSHWQVNILLLLYGLPGDEHKKVRQYSISSEGVSRLRKQARVIALAHIPNSISIGGSSHGEQNNHRAQSARAYPRRQFKDGPPVDSFRACRTRYD